MYPDSHLTWSNLTVLVKLLLVACQDQEVVVSRRASEEGHSSVVRSENLCTLGSRCLNGYCVKDMV